MKSNNAFVRHSKTALKILFFPFLIMVNPKVYVKPEEGEKDKKRGHDKIMTSSEKNKSN